MEPMLSGAGTVEVTRLVLRREDWWSRRRADTALSGLEACRDLFGA